MAPVGAIADQDKQRYAFYRYHANDPVYFRKDVRVTLQQICLAGEALGEMDLKHLPQ